MLCVFLLPVPILYYITRVFFSCTLVRSFSFSSYESPVVFPTYIFDHFLKHGRFVSMMFLAAYTQHSSFSGVILVPLFHHSTSIQVGRSIYFPPLPSTAHASIIFRVSRSCSQLSASPINRIAIFRVLSSTVNPQTRYFRHLSSTANPDAIRAGFGVLLICLEASRTTLRLPVSR